MESFYVDLLNDKTTTALMQGYDYIAFVEWNQKTKRITNTASKSSANDNFKKGIYGIEFLLSDYQKQ